jgi:hypothetical protein
VGRVWPRHGHCRRPLNSVVSPPSMNYLALAAGVALTGNVCAMETCESLNRESPIDVAYVNLVQTSKMSHRLVSTATASKVDQAFLAATGASEQICYDESLEDQASRLRSEAKRDHPQKCMTFEKAADVTGIRELLRDRNVPNWRESTSPPSMLVCYLTRDSAKVDQAVKEKFEHTWYKKSG